jgi:glycosyltransferase involved in cell wall biosynthesis
MISVIVPYNKDRGYLEQCVKSIESQDVRYEIILSKSDKSVAYNFNRGLEKANGEYCKFVCEDDWLPFGALRYLLDGIDGHDWIMGNAIQVDVNNWIYNPSKHEGFKTLEGNIKTNRIHGGTTLYRTELLHMFGGMDEMLWTGEEYDMHLRMMQAGYLPGYVDNEVYCHRLWSGQKSKILRKTRTHERQKEIERIQSLYTDSL